MAHASRRVGVLVMAYGTPSSPGQVEAFYTDVRRGRAPSADQLADLVRRYEAIGGVSPLSRRTAEQVEGIQQQLELRFPGRYLCTLGNKHSEPRIENAIENLAGQGTRDLVGIVLAPHYSRGSVGEYVSRASERATDLGMSAAFVEHWHDHPVLVELLAERVIRALESLGTAGTDARENNGLLLLVTAHSLPVRVVADGDPYAGQLRRTGELVASASGLRRWDVGWQSAGRTPEPWLGPDVLDRLRALPGEKVSAVVVCPAGFTSDHLEILYDLDIEASRVAAETGVAFARTASLNADPRMCAGLADLVIGCGGALGR
ncbi:MAG: ferrochelatase [Acidimicrobiales bacterium]|jgi:ferrochelatase